MRGETTGNQCLAVVIVYGLIGTFTIIIVPTPFVPIFGLITLIPCLGMTLLACALWRDEDNSRIIQGIEFIREDA